MLEGMGHETPSGTPPARGAGRGSEPSRSDPARSLSAEAAELIACDPQTSPVACDVFLYESDVGEEALGSLSLVLETVNVSAVSGREADDDTGSLSLDRLATTLRDAYYRDPRRPMLDSFEAALTTANRFLAAAAERGDADWVTNLHAAVAVFKDRQLHIARVGASSILLARQGRLTDIGEGLADPNVRNPKTAFGNIASGAVSEQDTLVLASQQIFRVVPRDRLPGFLAGKHPRDAVTYIRDLLAETRDATPIAALFLRFVRAPIALPAPRRTGGAVPVPLTAASAPPSLLARPRLTPRLPLRVRQTPLQRAFSLIGRGGILLWTLTRSHLAPLLTRAGRTGIRAARTAAVKTSASAKQLVTKSAAGRPSPTGTLSSLTRSAVAPRALVDTARAAPRRLTAAVRQWPRSTKLFSAATVLLVLLFAVSLVLLKQKREEETAIRAASEQLQSARVKKDNADAALIYENLDEARRLLREARAEAQGVEQTPYYNEEVASLLGALQATEDKTERIVRVTEPARAGDFRSVAPDGKVSGLAVVGNQLFTFHPETNAIFRLAAENGETTTVSQTSEGVGYFRTVHAIPAEQMLLLATDSPGLALFDTARGDLIKQDLVGLPDGTKEIRALATFGSRLYLLLPEAKQIYGFSKTLAGYQGGAPWLKDGGVSAEQTTTLGVDGYIYLLGSDGKITKLLKGSPVDFSQSELTLPLANPTRLVITEQLKFLYVLDPANKRVVVYDTTGKLSRQFVFPNSSDLKDLTVAGKDETLFVLDGTAVYKVPLK